MKQWTIQHSFLRNENDDNFNRLTSISVNNNGEQVYAGSKSGEVYLFERRIDGTWDNTMRWIANKEMVDVRQHKAVSGEIIDTDIFSDDRKSPLLITAGIREIRIWLISDSYEPHINLDFHPNGIQFPPKTDRKRYVSANNISLIRTDLSFTSVRTCLDGMTFAYTEGCFANIRRIDHLDSPLTVFKNDCSLTRVDFHPKQYHLLLTGDEKGISNMIDLRIQPTQQKSQNMSLPKLSVDHFNYISDCRFSPDGSKYYARYFNDLLIWDIRNLTNPISTFLIPPYGLEHTSHLSENGREYFKSSWMNNTTIATGWLGNEMFFIDISGPYHQMYANKKPQKSGHSILKFQKKKKWQKRHIVSAIDIPHSGHRAAATNGTNLFIYDFE